VCSRLAWPGDKRDPSRWRLLSHTRDEGDRAKGERMEADFSSWYRFGQELNAQCVDETPGSERWELVTYGNKLGADRFLTHATLAAKLLSPADPDPLSVWSRLVAKDYGTRGADGKLYISLIHEKSIATLEKLRAGLFPGGEASTAESAPPVTVPTLTKREVWYAAKVAGIKRQQVIDKAFPGEQAGMDRFKKWLLGAAYPDGSPGDTAIRIAIAKLMTKT